MKDWSGKLVDSTIICLRLGIIPSQISYRDFGGGTSYITYLNISSVSQTSRRPDLVSSVMPWLWISIALIRAGSDR